MDDLAQYLHHFPRNYNDDDRELKLEEKMNECFSNPFRPKHLDPDAYGYFEGQLHDGYVLGVERTKERVEISIQNSLLADIAYDFLRETERDEITVISPVRLVFEGVNYANAVRADAKGWLKWDDWSRWRTVEDPRSTDTFLHSWFHEQEGKTQWVGHFHKWNGSSARLNGSLFVLIDCDRVTAKPESERAMRKRLGDECYDAVQFVQSLPREEWWISTGHLQRYLDAKGIPRRHIPHQSEREASQ